MDRCRFEYPEDVYEPGERVPEYSALVWDRGPAGDFGTTKRSLKCSYFLWHFGCLTLTVFYTFLIQYTVSFLN
jgi:hypothetical protein